MNIYSIFSVVFLGAFIFTVLIAPALINFCLKNNFTDYPDARKVHKKPVPRLGGISIFLGSIFSFLTTFIFLKNDVLEIIDIKIFSTIILGGLILFIVGITDDIKSVSPWKRLFIQILVSLILWNNQLAIKFIDLSWLGFSNDHFQLYKFLSIIVTIFWISGVTNAINWLDGLDGLATGVTFIASIGFFFISYLNNQLIGCVLSLNLAGSCLGFWFHNKYPAKIFMGDGGSYYLGYSIGVIGIIASSTDYIQNSAFVINPFYAFSILSLPVFDMAFVIFRRIKSGHSPFYPDCRHLHHRLINLGLNKKMTTNLIFSIASLGAFLGIFCNLFFN